MSRDSASTSPSRGFLRRTRGWTCPDCGLTTSDAIAIRLGFCTRCNEFTGMCAAGRKIICPDMMTVTAWHTPCTSLGTTKWRISEQVAMLCPAHDAQLRNGAVPWISGAVPLAKIGSRDAR